MASCGNGTFPQEAGEGKRKTAQRWKSKNFCPPCPSVARWTSHRDKKSRAFFFFFSISCQLPRLRDIHLLPAGVHGLQLFFSFFLFLFRGIPANSQWEHKKRPIPGVRNPASCNFVSSSSISIREIFFCFSFLFDLPIPEGERKRRAGASRAWPGVSFFVFFLFHAPTVSNKVFFRMGSYKAKGFSEAFRLWLFRPASASSRRSAFAALRKRCEKTQKLASPFFSSSSYLVKTPLAASRR